MHEVTLRPSLSLATVCVCGAIKVQVYETREYNCERDGNSLSYHNPIQGLGGM